MIKLVSLCCALLVTSFSLTAKGVYQTSDQFIAQTLGSNNVSVKTLWLSADDKQAIQQILNHKYSRLRIRYWQQEQQTVWVLEEVGKEKPITVGVHINGQQIEQLKVLTYREQRGGEVKHSFFTKQFEQAKLTSNNQLDRHIDGITGATLSVRALTKVARLALWLNKHKKKS